MQKLKVVYKGKEYDVSPLSTAQEIILSHNLPVKDPMAVVVNGHFTRLTEKIKVDSTVEIIEFGSPLGRRIYETSVLFLFLVAFSRKFPELTVFIQHSIHRGVYAEIQGRKLNAEEIGSIDQEMRRMVKDNLPIERFTEDWDVSLNEMVDKDRQDIFNLYRYLAPSVFKYYKLEGIRESLYLPLAPSTGILGHFGLEPYEDGVVVMMPDENKQIPKFVNRPKLFNTYREYHEWSRILKVRTVGQLNRYIMDERIGDLIRVAEAFHEKKVAQIADQITKREHVPRLVLIAGPSSSGKTTFSKRLGIQLIVNGFHPVTINMDNYFVDRDLTPRDANGNYDFESLEAIDVALFIEHVAALLRGEEIEIPKFDFFTGTKRGSGKKLKLNGNQIIIIEGIHGINPKLTSSIAVEDKFKIYIAPLTQLNLHRHDRIAASDTRLIRRLVRDSYFRGYGASETLARWRSVREGEKKNIFPLQEEADAIYNSALFYELSVLKTHAERELLRVEKDDPSYPEARRLRKFMTYFLPLNPDNIPSTSILREFIGGSDFRY